MRYVTTQESDDYFEYSILKSEWDALTTDEKERALVTATRKIDAQRLIGKKYDPDQDLEFPRRYFGGYDEEVPQAVKDACCEEALALIERYKHHQGPAQGAVSVSAGDASETYSDEAVRESFRDNLHPVSRRLLRRWLRATVWLR